MILAKSVAPMKPTTYVSLPGVPAWMGNIGDLPDHYHGLNWSSAVMPNNYLFFLRQSPEEMQPAGVTHSIHHRHELVVAYAGAGRACVEDRIYDLAPATALLLAPGTFHRYFGFGEGRFTWLHFTFDLGPGSELLSAAGAPRRLEVADLELISEAGRLYTGGERPEPLVFEIGLRMGRLMQTLARRPDLPLAEGVDPRERESCEMLRKLATFVDRRMDQAPRIDDIAAHLGVSESNLRKLFRDRFGTSLGNYLRRSRLTRSVQLIHRGELSVSEIARLCGFESIFSFSQAFRRAIGMPPSAYRRHLAEGLPPIAPVVEREDAPEISE